jgi:perosamine synthetase
MRIPVAQPILTKNAKKYLLDCVDSGWLSSIGPYVGRFENNFAKYIGVSHGIATNSGTSAIHLALASLDIKPNDEVILPALTMIATVLPILYLGATPILVDSETQTGNIDVKKVEKKITKKTKAIIIVHLHGHPVEMDTVLTLVKKYNIKLIEDAAEAHGAEYKGKKVGSFGDIGCFSFYGNKIITTGEGGMCLTNNKSLAKKIRDLGDIDRHHTRHFYHDKIAYTYRMSNLQAAVGLSQLENIKIFIEKKRRIAFQYNKHLTPNSYHLTSHYFDLPLELTYAKSVYWQYGILIKKNSFGNSVQLAKYLEKLGIETRPFFLPMHKQPALLKHNLFKGEKYPVAESLSRTGLCLPSALTMTDDQIEFVSNNVKKFFHLS